MALSANEANFIALIHLTEREICAPLQHAFPLTRTLAYALPKYIIKTLQAIQGRFLRVATGAYRATSTEALEVETYTQPLDIYTENLALRALVKPEGIRTRACEDAGCEQVRERLRGKRGRLARARKNPDAQGMVAPQLPTTLLELPGSPRLCEYSRTGHVRPKPRWAKEGLRIFANTKLPQDPQLSRFSRFSCFLTRATEDRL